MENIVLAEDNKTLEAEARALAEHSERDEAKYSELYERLARQSEMTDEEKKALSDEVEGEVRELENTAMYLRRVQRQSLDRADELHTRLKEGRVSQSGGKLIHRAPANSVIDLEEKQVKNFAAGVNFYKIALILISGSFAGVIIEMLWCFIRHGYFESRAGLVYGPFNLLYGVGATALTLILYRYRNRSSAISFFGGMIVGSAVEYLLSWAQEKLFGSTSWDYSNVPLNINGRICLLYSVFWGLLGVMWIKSIYPRVAAVILKIPNRSGRIITIALTVFMAFNAIMSLGAVWRWSERVENKPAHSAADKFFDDRFPDGRMEKIFANMEFGAKKG